VAAEHMQTSESAATSRYARFQKVLKTAAGGATSDYGGLRPLWELSLDRVA
jgi:hypothetical protein